MSNFINDLISLLSSRNNGNIGELEKIYSAQVNGFTATEQAQDKETGSQVPEEVSQAPTWLKTPEKTKSTIIPCIIIDKRNRWHDKAKVDLKGINATDFTWQYYGYSYPVLVEQEDNTLQPFYLPESAGENCNVLYKKATSPGYRAINQRKNSMLQKLQVGLMVAVVIVLFVLMFVLLDWK